MQIGRRNLRKGLVVVGCVLGTPSAAGLLAGGVLVALGGALHLWSKGCLEQNRRLITAGPYRYVRNPFYLANALIDAGICVVIGVVWVAAVFAVLWLLAYRETIEGEERTLASLFPDVYPRYVDTVPRLVPNGSVWPSEEVTGRFRLDNDGLARGQEYARLVGIALGPAAICAAALVRRDGLGLLEAGAAPQLAAIVALPVLWVLKLAIAEVFRRPQSALVAADWSGAGRFGAAAALGGGAIVLSALLPPLAVVVAGWAGLVLLDEWGARRAGLGVPRDRWRYRRPVMVSSATAGALLLVLAISS